MNRDKEDKEKGWGMGFGDGLTRNGRRRKCIRNEWNENDNDRVTVLTEMDEEVN